MGIKKQKDDFFVVARRKDCGGKRMTVDRKSECVR
jgi:hypothetical protein